jgi:hypothetical protein
LVTEEPEASSSSEETPDADATTYDEALISLKQRCSDAKIELVEKSESELGDWIEINMPCGRSRRAVVLDIHFGTTLSQFLAIPFEKYTFLEGLQAICCYSDGTTEALLTTFSSLPSRLIMRRLGSTGVDAVEDFEAMPRIYIAPENDGDTPLKISIGPATDQLLTLIGSRRPTRAISLLIEGLDLDQHDAALKLLRKLSDALFFQIDLIRGVALTLARQGRVRRGLRRAQAERKKPLVFPLNEYDDDPMSLYWYGHSASGMPLLRFLAFYQVLEYYFPVHSETESLRKIRNILKDPTFRTENDSDVSRILHAFRPQKSGYGNEKEQLKATIMECVSEDSLKSFIASDPDRNGALSHTIKGLLKRKITNSDKDTDLRIQASNRIYELRCKIVHTKIEGGKEDTELLLPFAKEVDLIYFDIELIEFLAQRALIRGSAPMKI